MANLNKVVLIGNLCKDPEIRYTPNGAAVINITLAINRQYKVKDEVKKEVAFVPVVIWGKIAEVVNQYCRKGGPLMVEGRITTRSWEKDGQKHFKTEVVAENVQLIERKKESASAESSEQAGDPGWLEEEK